MLGLLEKVAHARSAHAHEHLHEIRAGNRQERHIGLSRHRLRQQGFTRSRRAYQQRALGNFRTDGFVFVGFLEEIDDLHDLDLCLLQSGNVLESHLFEFSLSNTCARAFPTFIIPPAPPPAPRDMRLIRKNQPPIIMIQGSI